MHNHSRSYQSAGDLLPEPQVVGGCGAQTQTHILRSAQTSPALKSRIAQRKHQLDTRMVQAVLEGVDQRTIQGAVLKHFQQQPDLDPDCLEAFSNALGRLAHTEART